MDTPVPPLPDWVRSMWESSEPHRSMMLLLTGMAPHEVRSLLNYLRDHEDDWQPVYPPSTDTPQ